jgi:hypothetical protein
LIEKYACFFNPKAFYFTNNSNMKPMYNLLI